MEISKDLVRRGHDVQVHTTPYLVNGFDKLPADDHIEGVNVRIYRLYPGFIFFPRVRNCDIVHLFSFGPIYYWMQSFLQSKKKLVTTPVAEEVVSFYKLRNRISLQMNLKNMEGGSSADRDAHFGYINGKAEEFKKNANLVISVYVKKKKLLGEFKNLGRT